MNIAESALDPEERLALVKWYVDQNRLDSALIEIKPLLVDETSNEVLITAARLYAQLRLFARAEALFSRYLEIDPGSINARFQLGMSRFDNGDLSAAIDTWQQILATDPHNPPALFYSALARLQNGDAGESGAMLNTILQHTATNNLYHGKARDLLDQLEQNSESRDGEAVTKAANSPYSTEH